ncbi:unnamed protein product [Prunus armeniaca]
MEETQPQSDQPPPFIPSQAEPLCQNDRLNPRYQNQNEEVKLSYEILPPPDLPSAIVPHQ